MLVTNFKILKTLSILQNFEEKRFPQKISYGIIKNLQILNKEREIYLQGLDKIISNYSDYLQKDENGKVIFNKNGLPVVTEEVKNDFYKEIDDLLSIQVEINPYFIPEATFNYENLNGRYDELSLKDTLLLMSILCSE
jgi:hypothetical protein